MENLIPPSTVFSSINLQVISLDQYHEVLLPCVYDDVSVLQISKATVLEKKCSWLLSFLQSHNKLMKNEACLTFLLPLLHLMDIIQTRTSTTFLARFTMTQDRIKRPLFHDAIPCRPARNVPSSLSSLSNRI